ncbi:MAG: hypothetical protein IJE59_05250 [Clostridia bacterium]|nr:hypothetical protein [Clostridia bacterium]
MSNLKQFIEFLPKKLQCKKSCKTEILTGYKSNIFYGYDENGQIYTITKDKNGRLHILERNFEQEEKKKYEALSKIGVDSTMSLDPMLFPQSIRNKDTAEAQTYPKEIILTPAKDRKGYSSITINADNNTYSITFSNGTIQLLINENDIQTTLKEQIEILGVLKKPFDLSLIDKITINRIPTVNSLRRVNHIASTFPKSTFVPITPKRMKEWDECEK